MVNDSGGIPIDTMVESNGLPLLAIGVQTEISIKKWILVQYQKTHKCRSYSNQVQLL